MFAAMQNYTSQYLDSTNAAKMLLERLKVLFLTTVGAVREAKQPQTSETSRRSSKQYRKHKAHIPPPRKCLEPLGYRKAIFGAG